MKAPIFIFNLFLLSACGEQNTESESMVQEEIVIDSAQEQTFIEENRSTELLPDINFSSELMELAVNSEVDTKTSVTETTALDFHLYTNYSLFLHSYVSSKGVVNYKGIKTNIELLNSLITDFQSNYPATDWSRNESLSYWINAYNLFTIKLVVDNYPTSSITNITAKPWDKQFIQLNGETLSLNDIEHKKIRVKYNEPRIHFALNCASLSCPQLLNKAFLPSKLDSQLTRKTRLFLADKSKNDFSNPSVIRISKLFDWYKSDFEKKGSLIDFINTYRAERLSDPSINYLEYSWDLND